MTAPGEAGDAQAGPRHPRNPWYGFLYAAILLVGAIGGFVALAFGWRAALAGDMYGQSTEGFVLFAPGLTAAGGVLLLVRAILAVGPWVRHRRTTPREARLLALAHDRANARGGVVAASIAGGLALAGFVLLAGFARPRHAMGAGLLLQFDALLLLVAIVCLKAAVQAVWANRRLARHPDPASGPAGRSPTGGVRYTLEFRQERDADGRPAEAVHVPDLPERFSVDVALGDAYRVLRDVEPTRTGRPGVYTYRDERGSGTLVVRGIEPRELDRLEERVQLHELERAIGMRDPHLWDRHAAGARRAWRNPWIATVLAGLVALGGLLAVTFSLPRLSAAGDELAAGWIGVGIGFPIAALGVFLLVFNVRRIQWWTRARAAVRAAGLPMPSDLRLHE